MNTLRKRTFQIILITSLAALISNCSGANEESGLNLVDANGNHFAGWIQEHGTVALSNENLCTPCHGDNLDGGTTSVSCSTASYDGQSCHASGPGLHSADWLNKNASSGTWHAEAYLTQLQIGGLDCEDCHTPPALDDPDGGKCVICHFDLNGSRSPGVWTHGIADHSSFAGSPEEIVCVTCHEVNNRFGNEPFCHNCHISVTVPHSSGWLDKSALDFHALAYNPAEDSCSVCHDPAQPTNPPGYICLDCHFSEDGSQRVPPGSGYTHGETTQEHQAFSADEAQVCMNCHDTNVQYGNQASCHNCHAIEAPHEVEYLDHDSVVPTSGDFTTQCSTCHSISPPPVTSAPVCTFCHTAGSPYTQTNCTSCHGQPPGTGKHGAHNGEASCIDCHQGAGSGSGLNHLYNGAVDVVFSASNFTYSGGRCSGLCHERNHNNNSW